MTWEWILLLVAGVVVLVALFYWQFIIAEGAYLGAWVVSRSYDLVARRYDRIKRFSPDDESWFIAGPLLRGLAGVEQPLLLDVATGTGRVPLALLRGRFEGQIVGLDLSRGMLHQAQQNLQRHANRVHLIWQDADHLPFDDGAFDAVTCLESLEFFPRPLEALSEMIRVLAPGGVLFLSNRVGHEAPFLPGRAIPRPFFEQVLRSHPLSDVEVRPWQSNYDLAAARKEGPVEADSRGEPALALLLCCPGCGGRLEQGDSHLSCLACRRSYSSDEGIVHLAAYETW